MLTRNFKWRWVVQLAVGMAMTTMAQAKQHQMPVYADFDLNADGEIDEVEFYQARGERIAERAAEGREMKNLSSAPSFADIDTNGDDVISAAEFSDHQAEHRQKKQAGQ